VPGTGLSYYRTQRLAQGSHALTWLIIAAVVAFLMLGR
jgi:hypothetical protein